MRWLNKLLGKREYTDEEIEELISKTLEDIQKSGGRGILIVDDDLPSWVPFRIFARRAARLYMITRHLEFPDIEWS